MVVRVLKTHTIKQLKMRLGKKIDIPLSKMKLIYFGTCLEDHFTVNEYDIRNNDKMHLMMSLCAMGKDGTAEGSSGILQGVNAFQETAQAPSDDHDCSVHVGGKHQNETDRVSVPHDGAKKAIMNVIKEGVKQGKNEIRQFSLEQMKAQVMISKLEKRLREDLTNHDSTLIGQVCDESLGLNLGTGSNLQNLISCQVKYEGIVSHFEAASLAGKTVLQM